MSSCAVPCLRLLAALQTKQPGANSRQRGARSQIRPEEVDRRHRQVSGRADLFLLEAGLSTTMISQREATPLEPPKELTGSQLPSLAHQGTQIQTVVDLEGVDASILLCYRLGDRTLPVTGPPYSAGSAPCSAVYMSTFSQPPKAKGTDGTYSKLQRPSCLCVLARYCAHGTPYRVKPPVRVRGRRFGIGH